MNTKTSILKKVLLIIIPLAIIAAVIIKLKSNKEITNSKVYLYNKEQAIHVEIDTIKNENITSEFSFSGTFEPNRESKISAEVQGKINSIFVDLGSIVQKGESLIQLDNSLLKLQLQTIELQIGGLETDLNRYTILAKADAIQGVQLEKVELNLKAAKIQKASILEQIYKTNIKAPFSGVVTAKLNEEGAFAAPGVPLLQITDIHLLKFTANVNENELNKFLLNHTYKIYADAFPNILLNGKTTMIGSKANLGSSFPIQFTVSNTSDMKIKSGMFGKVYMQNKIQKKGLIIPASAIIGASNQPQVYLNQNGKAVLKNITIAERIANNAIISAGIKEGDLLITNGFINLFDQANVIVK